MKRAFLLKTLVIFLFLFIGVKSGSASSAKIPASSDNPSFQEEGSGSYTQPRKPKSPLMERRGQPPRTMRGLIIVVKSWLEAEEEYKKVQDLPGIMEDVISHVEETKDEIEQLYSEMSYGKLSLEIQICPVDGTGFERPKEVDQIYLRAYLLCMTDKSQAEKGIDFHQPYDVIIVYPGKETGAKADGIYKYIPHLFYLGIVSPSFCGIRVSAESGLPGSHFKALPLSHEIGHCLGLEHAMSYDCNTIYKDECNLNVYGDPYDFMGGGVQEGVTLETMLFQKDMSVLPHINCVNKGFLKWFNPANERNVREGTHTIAALEYPSEDYPQCLVLDVDPDLTPVLPCDQVSIEYRTPRTSDFVEEKIQQPFGGALLHCVSHRFTSLLPVIKSYYTALLDCTPGSITTGLFAPVAFMDHVDAFVPSGKDEKGMDLFCDTNLGYKFHFEPMGDVLGAVTIIATRGICTDNDGDGFQYRDPKNPKGCKFTAEDPRPDCDDTPPDDFSMRGADIHPDALEKCNGVDDDCDTIVDGNLKPNDLCPCPDGDGDGFQLVLDPGAATACKPANSQALTDCNDANAAIHPGADETCNGIDDDCDGQKDEGWPTQSFYRDADGDTYGNPNLQQESCKAFDGYVSNNLDCNDENKNIHPGLLEDWQDCNEKDDNCDGITDGNKAPAPSYICPTCTDDDDNGSNNGINPTVGGTVTSEWSTNWSKDDDWDACAVGFDENWQPLPVRETTYWLWEQTCEPSGWGFGERSGYVSIDCRKVEVAPGVLGTTCVDPDGYSPRKTKRSFFVF